MSLNQKHYNILIYMYKYKYTALLHKKGPYENADEDADLKQFKLEKSAHDDVWIV